MVARASAETRSYISPYSFSFQRSKKRCAVSRGVLGGSGFLSPDEPLPDVQAKAARSATRSSAAGRRDMSRRITVTVPILTIETRVGFLRFAGLPQAGGGG